jgi:NAD(P)-dependent dehydrogenase (short-subunit alcohol dehydrogenase family)
MVMAANVISLAGEVAVVAGASGRLGPIWTAALLRAGADVVGLDVREDGPAVSHDDDAPPGHGRFVGMRADVTSATSMRDALAAVQEAFGPPSILVNNAGIDNPPSARGASWLFEDVPDDLSAAVLDVNALGVLRACQIFGAAMVNNGRGSIVNIGSLYGIVAPDPRMYSHLERDPPFIKPPAYGMSKAAVGALTRYLAALWGPSRIRVNTLSPGGVLGDQDPAFREKFIARIPMRRMATPEDLTGPLLFLASDQSRYVTGTEVVVDGGYVCW